ncbi:MAG: hypothetical protein LBG07_10945 [Treponema sp.]|jgi:hypothetical protein|nr:hypothetical protein [Treponema sp.]
MKNIAKLALFFTISFAALFILAACVRFLHIRIDIIRSMPPRDGRLGEELLAAFRWALPAALYFSLLLSLSYTVRRRIFAPAAMLCLFILGSAVCFGITVGAESLSRFAEYLAPSKSLGNPGLILTQADNAIVLIQDPKDTWGPRVVSIPGRPLLYQELPRGPDGKPISLPPISFRTDTAWILQSFVIDFSLAGGELVKRIGSPDGSLLSFAVYTCTLVFLLVSLRFALALSHWPLANLFLGILVFRGILSMEVFLDTPETEGILNNLLGELIPPHYAVPLVFVFLGSLICLYTFLSFLARRKGPYEA